MADKKYTYGQLAKQFVSEIVQGNFSPKIEKRTNDVVRGVATYSDDGTGQGAAANAADTLRNRKKVD